MYYVVSFSLLCHFSHTVLLPVSFVVELLLSIFFPCHAIYHGLFFFLKSTVSDCIYWINRIKFLLCFFTWCYDYIFRLLPCIVYVLFISSCNTPNLFWSDNWDSFTMFESFNFSVSDFFFGLCLSYFLCQKTLSLQLVDDRWWSEDTSAILFALTSYRDDLWAIAMWSTWFSYLRLVLQRLVNFLQ